MTRDPVIPRNLKQLHVAPSKTTPFEYKEKKFTFVEPEEQMCDTEFEFTSWLHWTDPPRTLPTPWNAGFFEIEWATIDFTKSEVKQRQRRVVLNHQKVPLQGLFQCSQRVRHDDFLKY